MFVNYLHCTIVQNEMCSDYNKLCDETSAVYVIKNIYILSIT